MPDLIVVNGEGLPAADAVRRSIIHQEEFLERSIELLLLRQYAASHGIVNTDEQLQLALDEMRYQRGLESVEKARQWMKANHQTELSLQDAIDGMLIRNKVRNSIPEEQIAAYYAEHQLEFEKVTLYSIRLDSEEKAKELYAQITEEGANFHVLAMEHSTDSETAPKGGYVGEMTRAMLSGEIEAAVFKAKPGDVIGPIKTSKGWNLFKVAKIHKPTLAEVRSNIQMTLFLQLLAKLRAEAKIEYPIFESEEVAVA
ncbi:MAG TPA: peptidylprolyl isomerase [Bryobacteraceae bacterium]|nr:peptidylprolyl isomerase [Bryobacteraceae bacterium]HOL70990.1 peptidylprolyl isomerase [Bryobacteraceae bacterium]HOQ47808.1 peptidylprolyl isomerase [Bryobacteraceae bacterium]HPQ15234.1 peptidylprolyl isomerase [Bryobacteraceae bacterium]HPU73774.1 peptidylprolyl isomerase [Bryobacteraceae bacterium]